MATRAKRGRPTGDHDANKVRLLKAASTVIAREGLANASLRKVAEQAGCTTGAVTYYFANREALILELARAGFDHFDAMLESSRESGDAGALLRSWLERSLGEPDSVAVMSEMLAHGRHQPALAELIAERYDRFRRSFTSIIEQLQEKDVVRSDIDAELLVDQLSAMGDGWALLSPVEPGRFSKRRIPKLVEAAVRLVSPPGG